MRERPSMPGGKKRRLRLDAPQYMDQYMEPAQPGVQDILKKLTEVHIFHRTGQTDRTVYWTVPHASGKELWLEPWPDDQFDRTEACLSRPVFHFKKNGRARFEFKQVDSKLVRATAFLVRLAHTVRTNGLSDNCGPIFKFDHLNFYKERIFKPSDDLSHIWSRSVHDFVPSNRVDCPGHVLLLTAGYAEDTLSLDIGS
ncbi:hypothetical protein Bca4012_026906 [Brassica carinata]